MDARTIILPTNIDELTEEQLAELDDDALEIYQQRIEEQMRAREENIKKKQAELDQQKALEERETALRAKITRVTAELHTSEAQSMILAQKGKEIDAKIGNCDERIARFDERIAELDKKIESFDKIINEKDRHAAHLVEKVKEVDAELDRLRQERRRIIDEAFAPFIQEQAARQRKDSSPTPDAHTPPRTEARSISRTSSDDDSDSSLERSADDSPRSDRSTPEKHRSPLSLSGTGTTAVLAKAGLVTPPGKQATGQPLAPTVSSPSAAAFLAAGQISPLQTASSFHKQKTDPVMVDTTRSTATSGTQVTAAASGQRAVR